MKTYHVVLRYIFHDIFLITMNVWVYHIHIHNRRQTQHAKQRLNKELVGCSFIHTDSILLIGLYCKVQYYYALRNYDVATEACSP